MDYQSLASQYARQYGIPPDLFHRVIKQESGWNPNATSPVGAMGFTQVMPDTARSPGFGVQPLANPYDPNDNLRFGAQYLAAMMNRYDGNVPKALAAYNWGAGNADKWNGDLNALPAETRDYITKINGGPMILGRDMQGRLTPESLKGMANAAILRGEQPPMPDAQASNSFIQGQTPGILPSQGGGFGMPPMGGGMAPPQESYDNSGIMGWLMPNKTEDQRDQRLLAIGAGLLSGDDWSSGLANASQGLLSVTQEEAQRKQELEDQQTLFAQQLMRDQMGYGHEAAMQEARANSQGFAPVGSVQDSNGEIHGGVFADPSTGQYFKMGANGERIVIDGAIPLNRSDAAGTSKFSAGTVEKTRAKVIELGKGIETIDRVLPALDKIDYGIPGFMTQAKAAVKTLTGSMGLSEEELMRQIASGEISGMLGYLRSDIAGPGAMSDQDVLRVLAAVGGDVNSIFTHPDTIKGLLTTRRKTLNDEYGLQYDQYNSFRGKPGGEVWLEIPRYTGPASNQSGPVPDDATEDILKGYGL